MARLVNVSQICVPQEISIDMLNNEYRNLIGNFYPTFAGVDNRYIYFDGNITVKLGGYRYEYVIKCTVPLSELPAEKIHLLPPSIGTKYAVYTFRRRY